MDLSDVGNVENLSHQNPNYIKDASTNGCYKVLLFTLQPLSVLTWQFPSKNEVKSHGNQQKSPNSRKFSGFFSSVGFRCQG